MLLATVTTRHQSSATLFKQLSAIPVYPSVYLKAMSNHEAWT